MTSSEGETGNDVTHHHGTASATVEGSGEILYASRHVMIANVAYRIASCKFSRIQRNSHVGFFLQKILNLELLAFWGNLGA